MIKLTKKRVIIFVVLVSLLISSIVPFIRFFSDKPLLLGEQSYYDIRIAKTIIEKGWSFEDESIIGGRDYTIKPEHLILSWLLYFFPGEYILIILLSILNLLSTILFYLILREFKIKLDKIFFILLIFILSPIFIASSGTSINLSISIFLLFLGTYLFQKYETSIPALIIFLISVFFNLINVIVIILLLMSFSDFYKEKNKKINLFIILIILLTIIYYIPLYFMGNIFNIIEKSNFINFISDLGGLIGISIFTLILGIIGIIDTWKYKEKLKNSYYLILVLFIISFYYNYALIYLNIIITIFAGLSLTHIINRKWEVKMLKRVMILLLVYGLLFSALSYVQRASQSDPNKDIQEALEWLKSTSNEENIVFSHYSKGLWIEYWSDRPVVTDSLFNYDDVKQRLEDSDELLNSRNINKTTIFLNKYNISYIFIDKSMKSGQVWEEKTGLWYSFRNKEIFNNIYDKNDIEIWEVYFK